ncbi:hypothetical protein LINPERPRIM_LOCUS43855 [Linum perenne]
MDGVT